MVPGVDVGVRMVAVVVVVVVVVVAGGFGALYIYIDTVGQVRSGSKIRVGI